MQPALSVDQGRRSQTTGRAGEQNPAFSLVFEGHLSADPAGSCEWHDLILAASEFGEAHQFAAVWLLSQPVDPSTDRTAASRAFAGKVACVAKGLAVRTAESITNAAESSRCGSQFWVAVGEDSEHFKLAAHVGAHVLVHLLGRSIEPVAKDIELYRRSWTEAGRAGRGHVTLVVPTLVGEDEALIEAALEALRERLRRQTSLLREAVWDFPAFLDESDASGVTLDEFLATRKPGQTDELSRFAAERYISSASLIGGHARCVALVEKLKQIGVDEIGCHIDMGWPADLACEQLEALNDVKLMFQESEPTNASLKTARPINGHAGDAKARFEALATKVRRSSLNETEDKLAELWGGLLDVSEIGPADNFFDLGGHSLLAARAVSEIERAFGARLAIKTLMVSSLSQLAVEIERTAAARPAAQSCENAVHDASPAHENSKSGLLASWFKNTRNGDRFQDGSQPC